MNKDWRNDGTLEYWAAEASRLIYGLHPGFGF